MLSLIHISRQSAVFVAGVLKDAFSLWLNQNVQDADRLAEMAISLSLIHI